MLVSASFAPLARGRPAKRPHGGRLAPLSALRGGKNSGGDSSSPRQGPEDASLQGAFFNPLRALSRKEADPKASQLAKPSVDRTARIGNRVPQGPPGAHAHISSAARRVAQTAAAGASTRYKAMVSTPPSMIPQNPHAMQGWGVAAAAAATAAAGLHGSFNHRGEPIFLEDSPQGSVSEAQARLRVLFNETIPREEWQAAQRHIQELKGYLETANRTLATLPSKSEWDGVRTQLHELEYKLGVAQDELSTAHAQKAEIEQELSRMEALLEEKERALAVSEEARAQDQERMTMMKAQHEAEIANLEAERASLEMRYQEAIREVEEGAAQRIAAIEREKAEMEAAYQQRVAALEAELAGAGEMLAAAEARLESEVAEAKERYESQATSLRAELSAAMERAKSADARKDEEVARVLELRAQMESLRSGMERDRINAERAYEQETARLREALSLAEGRMVELSPADGADYVARVAELERELEVARAEAKAERELLVNEMESQVYEVRLELDAARSALADAEIRAHEQADVEVERLRRMLLEAQELAAGAVRESEQKYGREVVSVRQALLEAERELETLMEARSDWEEREEALVAEVSALRARTGELEAEKRAERERGRREMACELKERGGEMTADEWEEATSASHSPQLTRSHEPARKPAPESSQGGWMAALRSRLEASRMDFEARVAAIGASIPGGSRGKSREEDPEEMRMQAVAREMRDRDRQHKMEVAAMTAQLQSRVRDLEAALRDARQQKDADVRRAEMAKEASELELMEAMARHEEEMMELRMQLEEVTAAVLEAREEKEELESVAKNLGSQIRHFKEAMRGMSQDMHKLQSFARERSGASGGETDVSHVAVANAPTHAPESSALESVDEFGRVHLGAPAATTGAVGPDAFGYFTRADVVSDDAHERQSSAVSTSTAGDTFGGADVEVADEERTGSGEGHEAWGAQDVQERPPVLDSMGNIVDVPAAVIGRWEQESVVGSEGALVLKSAGVAFPHVDKEGRGEDAFFVSGSKAGMFGVADGVGGWNMEGVDPGEFSRLLANNARRGMEAPDASDDLRSILDGAHRATDIPGGSTCVIARLTPTAEADGGAILEGCNLGDSGFVVFRNGRKVFEMPSQSHGFNMPFQFAQVSMYPESDTADDADLSYFHVMEGDVIVAGSDGLWDNVWDYEIADEIIKYVRDVTGTDSYGPEPGSQKPKRANSPLGSIDFARMMDPQGLVLSSKSTLESMDMDVFADAEPAREVDLSKLDPKVIAGRLAEMAQVVADDDTRVSPVLAKAKDEGALPWQMYLQPNVGGGKMDDCTVIVSFVVRSDSDRGAL